jgi:valyl-tRNA synthetase
MSKLPDRYNAQETEKRQQDFWVKKEIYKWQNDLPKKQTFVIDTPPPTVSGLLHMGHIFSYTQADFIARYKRMRGFDVFYPMGFDDNGLPTERLVEKVIGKKAGTYEAENGQESFVTKCREVVVEAEKEFEALFNTIALSVDWSQKYQTISPESQKLSQASFVDLFNKNLVERRFAPVFWDCVDRTALSQADLVDKEINGMANEIEFSVEGVDKKLLIMTTRPELLPACVAVMVHPEDKRFKHLQGKKAITPLFGVKVPIIADDLVQMDKGTGAVMCCTFGDETDIKWWQKHQLELRIILEKNGLISNFDENFRWTNLDSPEYVGNDHYDYADGRVMHFGFEIRKSDVVDINIFLCMFKNIVAGKKLKEAKELICQALIEAKFLLKQTPIQHSVKCAERSGTPIEILTMPQWFVKILDKKEELKAKANECNWYPKYMKLRLEQWVDNLAWDWCISRQRFFGVKFPVWYSKRKGEEGKIIVANVDQLPCDPNINLPEDYSRNEVRAENDIMDTWATSSISPQLSSKGISNKICFDVDRHNKLFPADLRPQAHEIIRTWAFYTITKSMLHQSEIPWKNLMISGWCLAADKTKMSKSKGNVITPQSLIEQKGSDVVRYWASTSNLGTDTAYSEDLFKIGGKLITKLFNAAKFVSQNFVDLLTQPATAKEDIKNNIINQKADLWILSRLKQTIIKSEEEFDQFEYSKARQAIEDFFWNDFCDNYLEIVKVRSYGIKAEKYKDCDLEKEQKVQIINNQQSGLATLYHCLEALLKLFAPFVPHITEEIYQTIFLNKIHSIHQRGSWCRIENYTIDKSATELGNLMLEIISNVRKYKSDNNLSMKTTIKSLTINTTKDISLIIYDLKNVCNAIEIIIKKDATLSKLVIIEL